MKVRTKDGIRDMRALWLEGDEVVIALPDNRKEFEVLKVITIHENNNANEG